MSYLAKYWAGNVEGELPVGGGANVRWGGGANVRWGGDVVDTYK